MIRVPTLLVATSLSFGAAVGCGGISCEEERTCGIPRDGAGAEAGDGSDEPGNEQRDSSTDAPSSKGGDDAGIVDGGSKTEDAEASADGPLPEPEDAQSVLSDVAASRQDDAAVERPDGDAGQPISACSLSPCRNSGTCVVVDGGATCRCAGGFTGEYCEMPRFVIITPTNVTGDSGAYDVSADGTVVTGQAGRAMFLWTPQAGSQVVSLGNTISSAIGYGLSADGSVVVGRVELVAGGQQAFRWSRGSGLVGMAAGGTADEVAYDVSADGSTVVGHTDRLGGLRAAFRWTNASGMTQLPVASGVTYSEAAAVSADGSVVVGVSADANDARFPARWSGSASAQVLSIPLNYNYGSFLWVTADGTTAFGNYGVWVGSPMLFRWTETGGSQVIPAAGSVVARNITGVSPNGQVVLGNDDAVSGGFVWELPNGQPKLLSTILQEEGVDLNGLVLDPRAASHDGSVVVGLARAASGPSVAFLARWR